jgi:hypothetical protein
MTAAPKIFILLHIHVCASCGEARVCEDKPCWLTYGRRAPQWSWICSACLKVAK